MHQKGKKKTWIELRRKCSLQAYNTGQKVAIQIKKVNVIKFGGQPLWFVNNIINQHCISFVTKY